MKRMPQPIPYQGSKRNIAAQILSILPGDIDTLVEPFAGSAAVSIRAAYTGLAHSFHLNDLNRPLMDLLNLIINEPDRIASDYERLWHQQLGREREFYDEARAQFNATNRPDLLLYLLARCVKASVRYNAAGEFNQSPDNRRKGRRPHSMRGDIHAVSRLLKGRTRITSSDFTSTIDHLKPATDLLYMDPPYQGTSGGRDARYCSGVDLAALTGFLAELNAQGAMFVLSYDGRKGSKTYGRTLPEELNLVHVFIEAGRSTQSTLLGQQDVTYESLYLSSALIERIEPSRSTDTALQYIASAIRRRSERGGQEIVGRFQGVSNEYCMISANPHNRRTGRATPIPHMHNPGECA